MQEIVINSVHQQHSAIIRECILLYIVITESDMHMWLLINQSKYPKRIHYYPFIDQLTLTPPVHSTIYFIHYSL